VRVNGEATGIFSGLRGFVKATHYPTFILVMESLNGPVYNAIEVGLWEGFLITDSQSQGYVDFPLAFCI